MHQIHSLNQKHLINLNECSKPHENDCSTKQEFLFLKGLSSFVLTFRCQQKTTPNYNSREKHTKLHVRTFWKTELQQYPSQHPGETLRAGPCRGAAKDTVLSEHLQIKLFGIQQQTELCKPGSNSKMKNKHPYNGTRHSTKSVLKKVVAIKASEKDRWMNQRLSK